MELQREDVHDIRNQLSISLGMVDIVLRLIERNGPNLDLEVVKERLQQSVAAQKKLLNYFAPQRPTDFDEE